MSSGIQYFGHTHFGQILKTYGHKEKLYNNSNYKNLNNLYLINSVFSSAPWGDIIDRSGKTDYPFKLHIRNKWTTPNIEFKNIDLESACNLRIEEIISKFDAPYNLYWSGGIDSTLMLIGFFKRTDIKDINVCLTKNSIKENTFFYENFIKKSKHCFVNVQTYIPKGTNITAECGDTIWAAIDHGFFFNNDSKDYVFKNWQDYFQLKNKDPKFLEFAFNFMSEAQRPITTLLEARWWFYFLCKHQSKATNLLIRHHHLDVDWVSFYESRDIESWIWFNIENIIKGHNWYTYKFPAKEIIYKFDKNQDYLNYKTKEYSMGLHNPNNYFNSDIFYQPLFITDDLEKPILSTEPFFSKEAYKKEFHEKYKHLFVVSN